MYLECDVCKQRFSSLQELQDHESHEHDAPWDCLLCGKSIKLSCELKPHMYNHLGRSSHVSNRTDSYFTQEKPFKCDICDRTFTTSGQLKKHTFLHTGVKPIKCDICDGMFTTSGQLKKHICVHTEEKPFKCDICDKMFTTSGQLKKHICVHTEEKPFKCDICDKMFTRSGQLKKHVFVHTGERLFKCDICDKMYTTSGQLKLHRFVHTAEKSIKCDGRKTYQSLINHQVVRGDRRKWVKYSRRGEKHFECDICDRMYTTSGQLKLHRFVHTAEKPIKCDGRKTYQSLINHQVVREDSRKWEKDSRCGENNLTCDRCHNRSDYLKSHTSRDAYIREKPFKCDMCDKVYHTYINIHTKFI